ncbi:MAG: flavodoxin family protein [Patescibacteria group bacterium]
MNKLIIYDSLFGNTKKVAEAIGEVLGPDAKVEHINDAAPADLTSADLLVIGSPTHGGRPSQPMQKFLNTIGPGGLKNVRAAAFDTGNSPEGQGWFLRLVIKFFGYASDRLARTLKTKGANVIAAETFYVLGKEGPLKDGELERAKGWTKELTV